MKKNRLIFGIMALLVGVIVGLGIAARFDLSSRVQSQAEKPGTPASQSPSPTFEGDRKSVV